jgi:hypothetical protein
MNAWLTRKSTVCALLGLSVILNPLYAFARGTHYVAGDDTIEISFTMKLFGGAAGKDPLAIAQGVADLPFEVVINSPIGPLKCAMGSVATGPTSALQKLADASTVPAAQFDLTLQAGDEIVCQTDEDRKLQVTYRIPKAAAENTVTAQIDQTLADLKSGQLQNGFANDILTAALKDNLKVMPIHLSRNQPIQLGQKFAAGEPMVALLSSDATTVAGSAMFPSGKQNTIDAKNIYPNLNRFALVCGFADDTTGQIADPLVPTDDAKISSWVKTTNGQAFGCIANNSPDGFDMFDAYSEDPIFNVHYLVVAQADLQAGLEKLRVQSIQAVDQDHVSKLETLANSLVDANKKRVQAELDKRRVAALVAAGYFAQQDVVLHPQAFYLSLSGKARYGQAPNPTTGALELRMDTVFDVQGERAIYSFAWVDKTKLSFTEDHSWVGLTAPLTTSDYDDQLSHFSHEYRICGSRGEYVRNFMTQLAASKTKDWSNKSLFAMLSKENATTCFDSAAGAEKRTLKYSRYEGSCFIETPYTPKDGAAELIRFKPTNFSMVYADASGAATAKVKVDLAKLGDSAALFSGLDVVTTIPYNAARAATYKINCDGKGVLPVAQFKKEDLNAQSGVPGFDHLFNSTQSATPASKGQK